MLPVVSSLPIYDNVDYRARVYSGIDAVPSSCTPWVYWQVLPTRTLLLALCPRDAISAPTTQPPLGPVVAAIGQVQGEVLCDRGGYQWLVFSVDLLDACADKPRVVPSKHFASLDVISLPRCGSTPVRWASTVGVGLPAGIDSPIVAVTTTDVLLDRWSFQSPIPAGPHPPLTDPQPHVCAQAQRLTTCRAKSDATHTDTNGQQSRSEPTSTEQHMSAETLLPCAHTHEQGGRTHGHHVQR